MYIGFCAGFGRISIKKGKLYILWSFNVNIEFYSNKTAQAGVVL